MMKYDRKYVSDEAVEKYDDARFAMLMEGYSARLGEDYVEENRRLQEDESFELPSGLDEKCMKAIDSAIARKRRHENMEKAKKAAKRITVAAASFLVVIAVSSVVLFNTVEAFRVVVSDYAIELFDIGEGSLVSVEANDDKSNVVVSPTWIPDGYEKKIEISETAMKMIKYSNGNGTITFTAHSDSSVGNTAIDTENAIDTFDVRVADHNGVAVITEQDIIVYWFEGYTVYHVRSDVEELETITHIIESCYY